jgi:hypothetical protein
LQSPAEPEPISRIADFQVGLGPSVTGGDTSTWKG